MEETLTLTRLQITGRLKRTLQSTNPIESMIEIVRRTSRNVKRWQSGDMCLRWTAAGMLEAEQQFRKIIGYSDLAKLAIAVERDLAAQRAPAHPTTTERPLRSPPSDHHTGTAARSSTTDGATSARATASACGCRVSAREPDRCGRGPCRIDPFCGPPPIAVPELAVPEVMRPIT